MPPRGPRGPRGARRGMMGGMPVSRSGKVMVNGHIVNPFPSPAGGYVQSPANGPVEFYATHYLNVKRKMSYAIQRNGVLKGTLIGIRHVLTDGLHNCMFSRKMELAEKDLKAEKITKEAADLRKMRAAAEYFEHLRKIGYYDEEMVSAKMHLFAEKLGIEYDDGRFTEGRSR